MRGYGQFCPVAKACEIVAERWTPLVLRELCAGSRRFGDLQRGVPLMSRTLLAQRLRELEEAGVVASVPKARGRGREYSLTAAGEEMRPVIDRLGEWGQRWARRQVRPEDLDAALLMWDIHRRIHHHRLPPRQIVVRFDFRGLPRFQVGRKTFWLVLSRRETDVCLKDPGFPLDLVVSADLEALSRVWMGDLPLSQALRHGLVSVDGPRDLARAFPDWLALSAFATVDRPRRRMPSPSRRTALSPA
ncbi:MAG: winged helix-turn-helix transcriptional regulator [Candidatus Rokuibacteriota bacterium]